MKMPHTHYAKGKTVWVRTRDGTEIVGKFVERKSRFVVLENAKIETRDIAAMTFRKLGSK